MKRNRSISDLAVAAGLVFGVGAAVIGCAGSDGSSEERDLGGFVIPASTNITPDFAEALGPAFDMAMTSTKPVSKPDMSMKPDMRTGSSDSCGSVDQNGICDGETLKYCNSSNMLTTKDCGSSGKVCRVSSAGYASCTDS